jgi:hypothetical protein
VGSRNVRVSGCHVAPAILPNRRFQLPDLGHRRVQHQLAGSVVDVDQRFVLLKR